jgi:hypothetical protein
MEATVKTDKEQIRAEINAGQETMEAQVNVGRG